MEMTTITQPCINGAKACGSAVYNAASYVGRPIVALGNSMLECGKWAMNGTLNGVSAVWARVQPLIASFCAACTSPFALTAVGVGGAAALGYKGMQENGSQKTAYLAGAIACACLAGYGVLTSGMIPA